MRRDLQIITLTLLLAMGTQSQELPVFRGDATIVDVPCVVRDERGRAVNDLSGEDFRLFVDGAQTAIEHIWRDAELPLRLAVINDVSQSQREQLSRKDQAIVDFLQRTVRGKDRAFVVAVNDQVILRSQVSAGTYGLRYAALPARGEPLGVPCGNLSGDHGHARPVCGGTALWNAVYATTAHLKLSGAFGNQALVILSDGNDTGSTHSFDEAMEAIHRSGAVVYAVHYRDAMNPEDRAEELKRLAEVSGGMFMEAQGQDNRAAFDRIEADLRGRYVLGFRPDSEGRAAGHHSLRVEVRRQGVSVRSRQEYSGLD
jgi:VWFA-related protein